MAKSDPHVEVLINDCRLMSVIRGTSGGGPWMQLPPIEFACQVERLKKNEIEWMLQRATRLTIDRDDHLPFNPQQLVEALSGSGVRLQTLRLRCSHHCQQVLHSLTDQLRRRLPCHVKEVIIHNSPQAPDSAWDGFIRATSKYRGELETVIVSGHTTAAKWMRHLEMLISNPKLSQVRYWMTWYGAGAHALLVPRIQRQLRKAPHILRLTVNPLAVSHDVWTKMISPLLLHNRLRLKMKTMRRMADGSPCGAGHENSLVGVDTASAASIPASGRVDRPDGTVRIRGRSNHRGSEGKRLRETNLSSSPKYADADAHVYKMLGFLACHERITDDPTAIYLLLSGHHVLFSHMRGMRLDVDVDLDQILLAKKPRVNKATSAHDHT